MPDVLKVDALEQLKPFLNNDSIMEIAIRAKNKRFKAFQKVSLDSLSENQEQKKVVQKVIDALNENNKVNVKNMQLLDSVMKLDQLNLLMNGLNLCATCVGFAIVCHKIDKMGEKFNQVLSLIKATNDLHLDFEFNQCVTQHSNMLDHRKTQDYFSLREMEQLVSREYVVLEMLVNHFLKEVVNDKHTLLYSILTMASMLSVSIRYYDEMYFYQYKDKLQNSELWHTSHDKWLSVFDKIASNDFTKIVQDFGFLELKLSASGCDAFYVNLKDSALSCKQDVIDNQKLLAILKTEELVKSFYSYHEEKVKQSISDAIDQVFEAKNDPVIINLLNQEMMKVGIVH